MAGLDATGFEAKALADILAEMQDEIHSGVSPTLNLSSTSLLGQYLGVTASQLRQLWEAAQHLYAGRDITQATGDALAGLCLLTGTIRQPATYSTVLMTITLAAGTYPAGSLVVHVVGDPTSRFANDAQIVTAGATIVGVPFTAEELGPVRANANTLTVIADPVVGFSAPNNPAEATLGLEEESDAALRLRQAQEVARVGSTTVDAIKVDVADTTGVSYCAVFENDTDVTVDGIPPHSFECLVLGGVNADIAETILSAKPAGIRAYGTTTVSVTDTQGNTHSIGFTRPDEIDIMLDVSVSIVAAQYAGDVALKQALTDWFDLYQSIGHDVLKARMESICLGVEGVVDALVEIGEVPGPTSAANFVIAAREIARLDQGDITVSQTVVAAPP